MDKRVGDWLTISGVDAYTAYGADLISFSPGAREVTAGYSDAVPLMPAYHYTRLSALPLEVQVYVWGPTWDTAQANLAALIEACKDCVLRTAATDYEYAAILTEYSAEETGVEWYYHATLSFITQRRKDMVRVALQDSGQVVNGGTTPSGCILTITPPNDEETFEVMGVTIKDLHAGQPFVVDGIGYTVTENSLNRFADTDMTAFPQIKPGRNTITMSKPMPVTVEFYPTYL